MTAQVEAFRAAAKLLDAAGVTWWLSDGAVLGAVRDGGFLRTDPDVDLGVWAADMPTVRATFDAAGWPISRDRAGQLWAIHRGVKVDVHGHEHTDTGMVRYELARGRLAYQFPARLFTSFDTDDFCATPTRIVTEWDDYLTAHYGPDWRTPKPIWRWDRDPPCLIALR